MLPTSFPVASLLSRHDFTCGCDNILVTSARLVTPPRYFPLLYGRGSARARYRRRGRLPCEGNVSLVGTGVVVYHYSLSPKL